MKAWFEDEKFWLGFAPVLFNSSRWAEASGEMLKVVKLLDLPSGAGVLDVCCGVGRHALELARMGFPVTGIDLNAEFLSAAQETAEAEGFPIEFLRCDVRSFFHPFEFDAAINMFTSMGYFETLEEELQGVSNVRMALKPEGKYLVEMIGKEVVAREFKSHDWYEDRDAGLVFSEYRIVKNWSRLENHWITIRNGERFEYTFSHRLFSAVELESLLREAGFKDVKIFGNLDGAPYDEKADRLVAIGYA